MSKNRASISKGRSYLEIGDYWSEHDLGEVYDQTKPVEIDVDIRSQKHYYSLERSLSERVSAIAKTRGVSPETLINLWIGEKVGESDQGRS